MEKTIFLCLMLTLTVSYAQLSGNQPAYIPQVFPVSPEASSLGKFGGVSNDLAMGAITESIPLYNISASGFQLPISLNYKYTGLVVDEIPGMTGLGWSLNAGGMITRKMNGRPDEDKFGYIGEQMIGVNYVVPYSNNQLSDNQKALFFENASNGLWDTEPDQFFISVGGLQAHFMFDENKNIITKPYKPYEITVINGDIKNGFKVTDDFGIVYMFESKEVTKRLGPYSPTDVLSIPINGYVTAWKLSEIKLPSGKIITFKYKEYSYNQRIITSISTDAIGNNNPCVQDGDVPPKNKIMLYNISSKIIEEIEFPLGKINFLTEDTNTNISTQYNKYNYVLNQIKVSNINNKQIKKINFVYDDDKKTRKLIKRVIFDDDISNDYQFEYDETPSDGIPFHAQDYWGFYNSNTNPYLIVTQSSRNPYFNFCKVGSLIQITYPTGGTKNFEYELNTYDKGVIQNDKSKCELTDTTYEVDAHSFNYNSGEEHKLNDSKSFSITNEVSGSFEFSLIKNAVAGNLFLTFNNTDIPNDQSGQCLAASSCDNLCDSASLSLVGGYGTASKSISGTFTLKPGNYVMTARLTNQAVQTNSSLIAQGVIRLNTLNRENPPGAREVGITSGLRIKNIKICPNDNPNDCYTREYRYSYNDEISQSSSGFLFRKDHNVTHIYRAPKSDNPLESCLWSSQSFKSYVPLSYYSGSHVIYRRVIEKEKDYEGNYNGTKIYEYNTEARPKTPIYPFLSEDIPQYQNGKLKKEVLKNENGEDVLVKTNDYTFEKNLNFNKRAIAVKVGQINYDPAGPLNSKYAVAETRYEGNRDVDWLSTTTVTEKFGANEKVSEVNYSYTVPNGHMKRTDITGSDNSTKSTINHYPYEFSNHPLSSINNISTPVKTELKVDNELKQTSETIYRPWFTGIVKPQFVKTAKGANNLVDKAIYHRYDNKGNPLELSLSDGTHEVYIWGYNQTLPVAKIVNATYAQVSSYVSAIETKSNADDDRTIGGDGKEGVLRTELNKLRVNLPNALVTTYTYDPLIGVTSITAPNGIVSYYHYDANNRLEFVKDQNGNILTETKYNYANN